MSSSEKGDAGHVSTYRKQRRDRPLAGPDVPARLGLLSAGTQGSEFTGIDDAGA
jgi:hypothetical protein